VGIPDFTTGDIRWGFTGTLVGDVPWTVYTQFEVDSLGAFQCLFAVNSSVPGIRLGQLITNSNNLRFFCPGGSGDEAYTPSPALITGHRYSFFLTRVGTGAGDRNRYSLYDHTDDTWFRVTGAISVSAPAAHSGGQISIGRGDATNYPVDGRIAQVAMWIGTALTTNAHELECLAHEASTDLLNHSVGRPAFLPHLDVANIGEVVDYGTLGLTVLSSTGVAFTADSTDWNHDLDDPVAPPANDVPPAITGSLFQGGTLTGQEGTWSGAPVFTYQWLRDGVEIAGEDEITYVTQIADVGTVISLRETATNGGGFDTEDSNELGPIKASIPVPQRFDRFALVDDAWVRTADLALVDGAWVPV
jgi:hypothetical protein